MPYSPVLILLEYAGTILYGWAPWSLRRSRLPARDRPHQAHDPMDSNPSV
jgi:hypothetical protein